MSKRKSKKRKGKLSRPPKKSHPKSAPEFKTGPLPPPPPGWAEALAEAGMDAPNRKPKSRGGLKVHPSMYSSTRFQKFEAICDEIRAGIPKEKKTFSTYDVDDMKLRRWLARYAVKKAEGELPEWQTQLLDNIGFNWVYGRAAHPKKEPKPKKPRAPKKPKLSEAELAARWNARFEKLRAQIPGEHPALELLRSDDDSFLWFARQVARLDADELPEDARSRLKSLGIPLSGFGKAGALVRWKQSFEKHFPAEAEKAPEALVEKSRSADPETAEAAKKALAKKNLWSDNQRKRKKDGSLPEWQAAALDAVGFDWSKPADAEERRKQKEARWFEKLERYLELEAIHGKPLPVRIVNENGLTAWLNYMRRYYAEGKLRPEVVEAFKAKGFEFSGMKARKRHLDKIWNKNMRKVRAFKKKFGHAMVPASYGADPEFGAWLAHQRERLTKHMLSPERTRELEELGVLPFKHGKKGVRSKTRLSYWRRSFKEFREYLEKHHGGKVPEVASIPLKWKGWMRRQSNYMLQGDLDTWQIEALKSVGYDPENLPRPPKPDEDKQWKKNLERFKAHYAEQGHGQVSRTETDKKIYRFVTRMRKHYRKGLLSKERQRELADAGFVFETAKTPTPAWMALYEVLKTYHAEHGHSAVPRSYPPDQALAEFVAQQKQRGRKGMLLAEHIRLLDEVDFPWVDGRHPEPKDRPGEG